MQRLLLKVSVLLFLICNFSLTWSANLMKVNGQVITSEMADAAYSSHIEQSEMHLARNRDLILDDLLVNELLKQEALKKKLDQRPNIKILRDLSKQKALAEAFREYVLRTAPTHEADESKMYQDMIKTMDHSEQMRISGIFLNDVAQAQNVIKKLAEGHSFIELNEKYSTIESFRKSGGDLGWFSTGDQSLSPEFFKLISLKNGQFLPEPVELAGKFAVLEKMDTRAFTPPPFEALKPEIMESLRGRTWEQIRGQVYDALAAKDTRLSPKILNLAVSDVAKKKHLSVSQELRDDVEVDALLNRDLAILASKRGIESDLQVASELYIADQYFLADQAKAHFISSLKVSNVDLESFKKKFVTMSSSGMSEQELKKYQTDVIKSHKFEEYLDGLKRQAKIEKYPFYDSWVSSAN